MSRIGKTPIIIPANVKTLIEGQNVKVTGPKGELSIVVRPEIELNLEENKLTSTVRRHTKGASAYWGLTRALIANMVKGVTDGFEKKLELVGVGYRVKLDGPRKLMLSVGYSHPIEFPVPETIDISVEDNKNILIKGVDKQLVGLIAANIRKVRKPEPYKGKGIKYASEVVRRKAGKSGKA